MVQNKLFFSKKKSKSFWSYLGVVFSAILYVFSVYAFLQIAGIFSSGLSAFSQLLTYIFKKLRSYYSLIYLAFNIPIILFYWRKIIKKSFIYKTLLFLVTQGLFGLVFLIPKVDRSLINMWNFSQTSLNEIRDLIWPIFVLSLFGAIFSGVAVGLSWKFGGSSGGTDIISYHYSSKHKQSVGKILVISSLIMVLTSLCINVSVVKESRNNWWMTLMATIMYIIILSFIVDRIFPKYRKVKIEIHSEKSLQICKFLKKNKYKHAFLITKYISGYSNIQKNVIVTVMLLLEVKSFITVIKQIDPKAWIMEEKISKVRGRFNTDFVD